MTPEHAKAARTSLLLSSAPTSLADLLIARSTTLDVPHGKTIFTQGDPADAIHIILEGWVKLYRIAPSGAEAIMGVFSRGYSLAEAVALRGDTYPVFAEAVSDSILMRIEARLFLELLQNSPEMAIAMLTATYRHIHNFVAQIEQLKARTGPQRLAEFLLDLADCETDAPLPWSCPTTRRWSPAGSGCSPRA